MIPLLLARLNQERYAFYAQDVSEVILCPKLRHFASEGTILDGFFQIGDEWLPVISLAVLLNGEAPDLAHYDVLVVARTDPPYAIRVSSVDGVIQTSWEELAPLDSSLEVSPASAARLQVDSDPVLLLVVSELLLEKEREFLRAATLRMSERERRADEQIRALAEGSIE